MVFTHKLDEIISKLSKGKKNPACVKNRANILVNCNEGINKNKTGIEKKSLYFLKKSINLP